ncbi:hypothetical protein Hanom_Chr11g01041761 [Helianthus anomalus]
MAFALERMEERLQARIDATQRRTERLLMRAIQGDMQAGIRRGDTPLPIPSLSPYLREDADQGRGSQAPVRIQRVRIVVLFLYFDSLCILNDVLYIYKLIM